jgi:cbb3-type cytochrome oxidase maturation protein
MTALLLLIPLSLLFLSVAAVAFFWAVDHGQFEDMETPRLTPLADRCSDEGEFNHLTPLADTCNDGREIQASRETAERE